MKTCALFQTLWTYCPAFRAFAKNYGGAQVATQNIERHHIWGGKSRLNLRSNLIDLSKCVHDFAHHKSREGKIACVWAQWKAGKLNWEQLDKCAGLSARGWVEVQRVTGVYLQMQRELLNAEYATGDSVPEDADAETAEA